MEQDYELPDTQTQYTWYQFQYALLHSGTYVTINGTEYNQAKAQYWWRTQEEYIANAAEPEPMEELVGFMNSYLKNDGSMSATALKNKLTKSNTTTKYKIYSSKTGGKYNTDATVKKAKVILVALADDAKNTEYYKDGVLTLTWAQIQYYFCTSTANSAGTSVTKRGTLLSPTEALTQIITDWGWSKEGEGGDKPYIPDAVDLSGIAAGASLDPDGPEAAALLWGDPRRPCPGSAPQRRHQAGCLYR